MKKGLHETYENITKAVSIYPVIQGCSYILRISPNNPHKYVANAPDKAPSKLNIEIANKNQYIIILPIPQNSDGNILLT